MISKETYCQIQPGDRISVRDSQKLYEVVEAADSRLSGREMQERLEHMPYFSLWAKEVRGSVLSRWPKPFYRLEIERVFPAPALSEEEVLSRPPSDAEIAAAKKALRAPTAALA
jgi:hypothetical protein